jgi:ribosome-associated protein
MSDPTERSSLEQPTQHTVLIRSQPIELYKILKFEGFAASGAEAKQLIDDGYVRVNGESEFRRRRKIVDQDCIEIHNQQLRIVATTVAADDR